MQTEQAQVKRCTTCHLIKPLSRFRRRFSGSDLRHAECRDCANERARLSRLKKRDKEFHQFSQGVRERANNAAAVAELTAQMIRLHGGLDRFAVEWKLALDVAARERKHYLVVRGFNAIIRLIEASNQLEENECPLEQVEDRELQRQFETVAKRVVSSNPEIAVSAAHSLGWEIIPPPESGQKGSPE